MSANSKQPMNISFFMIRFLSLLRLKFAFLNTMEDSWILPFSISKQHPRIVHLSCIDNEQAGSKLQKIRKILEGEMYYSKKILIKG